MKKSWIVLMIVGVLSIGFTSCGNFAPIQEVQRTIVFNEDLSGEVGFGVAYNVSDFAILKNSYNDPVSLIATEMAKIAGWEFYDAVASESGSYTWVIITSQFSDPTEFYNLLINVTSDETSGVGGTGTGEELPPLSIEKTDDLLRTRYKFTWTLLAQAATSDTTSETYPGTLLVQLPGKIIETNGTILSDGKTVSWEWGKYDYVPVVLVTETKNNLGLLLIILAASFLCLLTLGAISAIFFFVRRKKQIKSQA